MDAQPPAGGKSPGPGRLRLADGNWSGVCRLVRETAIGWSLTRSVFAMYRP